MWEHMWNVDAKDRVGGAKNVQKGGKCGPRVDHKSKNVDKMWAPAPPNVATYVDVVWRSKCCINMFHIYVLA
jgi:hypothetical protein